MSQARVLSAMGSEDVALTALLRHLTPRDIRLHPYDTSDVAVQAIRDAFREGVFQSAELSSWAVGPLADVMLHGHRDTKRYAAEAILAMTVTGDARACSVVRGILESTNRDAQWEACAIFGKISSPGDAAAINLLLEVMMSARSAGDKSLSSIAQHAIAEIAGKEFEWKRNVCWFLRCHDVYMLKMTSRAWDHVCFFPRHDDD